MKNSADLGECYPPRPSASVDNTLLDLQNSSYPTQPHSIIAKYPSSRLHFTYHHCRHRPRLYVLISAILYPVFIMFWVYFLPM